MDISIGDRWRIFLDALVAGGRYESASEVVNEGLRLVEEREAKLQGLRNDLAAAIKAGGEVSETELDADLGELAVELKAKGVAP